jgi:hypothetical protein
MGVRRRRVIVVAIAGMFLFEGRVLRADNVKLDGGGSLSGSVTTGSKWVTVRTSTGALIVFDRTDVKQVTRGHTTPPKTGNTASGANAKPQPKKRRLTDEEEAWMPKVHGLVSRLYGSDREKSQQAKNALLNIDDTDAIPALSTYLGSSRDEEARHVFVVILHNMKGPKPVYYFVALSLYDRSPQIRSEARKAIREDQLDSARVLYIAALRSGPPRLARIAAIGIGEIGDPHGDSVPFLVNALVSYGTIATITEPAQYGLLYTITVSATPGLNLSGSAFDMPNLGAFYTGQGSSPIYLNPIGMAQAEAALKKATGPGQSLGIGGTINVRDGFYGAQGIKDFMPNSKGAPNVQLQETQNMALGLRMGPTSNDNTYSVPVIGKVAPAYDKKIRGRADHPEVLDALLKITDQKYPGHGFNQDRWRAWWANEKINRDLRKPAAPDRVIPSNAAH